MQEQGEPQTVVITNVNVIHPERTKGEAVQDGATVVIKGTNISRVEPSHTASPPGAVEVDGSGKWLLPGFIDTHVHFFQSGTPYTRPDGLDLTKFIPYEKENARNHARLPVTLRTWLACGVTSVMDMGGPFWNYAVREEARGRPDSPRVQVTGPLFSMVADHPLDLDDPPILKVSSLEEVAALAERQLQRKPDYLKVWYIHAPQDDLGAQEKLVKKAGDAAHSAGIRLAVHATELEPAKSALRAGADILVHSVRDQPVDEDFLTMAKERKAVYIPTLYVGRGYYEVYSRNWRPTAAETRLADPQILERMRDLEGFSESDVPERIRTAFRAKGVEPSPEVTKPWKTAEENLMRIWSRGITVTLGTDAGNIGTVHGPSVFREMALMVHAGLTPLEVLRCATTNGATVMGLQNEVGRVKEGYAADLVLLDSNPLEDIQNTSDVSLVVRNGSVFQAADLLSGR